MGGDHHTHSTCDVCGSTISADDANQHQLLRLNRLYKEHQKKLVLRPLPSQHTSAASTRKPALQLLVAALEANKFFMIFYVGLP